MHTHSEFPAKYCIYKIKNLRVALLYINSTALYTKNNLQTEVVKTSKSLNSNEAENKVET